MELRRFVKVPDQDFCRQVVRHDTQAERPLHQILVVPDLSGGASDFFRRSALGNSQMTV